MMVGRGKLQVITASYGGRLLQQAGNMAEQDSGQSFDQLSAGPDREASAAKALFLGNIFEQNVFPYPQFEGAERETLEMVLESVDKFMEGREAEHARYDEEAEQPAEYVEQLKELGLFGLIIPDEYGGIGLSNSGYSRVLQQTSRYDASTSLTIGAHSSIGMKGLLLFGNEAQKAHYLPKLATGEMIAAFCLTESGSGSDAASIKTQAEKQADGSWKLSGEKIWISNGPIADFFTVFARTGTEGGKMSAFIVERSFAGLTTGPHEAKMGIRGSATSTVHFQDVVVPAENLLGEEGKGFKIAMAILNNGRTGLGGGCVGAMKRAIQMSTEQANQRKQFGKPIAEFGLIQEKLAQMTVDCYVAESVVGMVGYYIDNDFSDYSTEAAISKVVATEALWRVANEALQIAGGNGFMKEYPYERLVRDARINMIFEGTNEILRLFIALSGMKDAGVFLKEISKGVSNIFNDPIKGFGVLSDYATKRFSRLTSLGRERLQIIDSDLRKVASVFEDATVNLAATVEQLLRRHGKEIADKQFACKRVAEIAIDIFSGLCVISRVSSVLSKSGNEAAHEELMIAKIFSEQAEGRMKSRFKALGQNHDDEMKSLAKNLSERGSYRWDLL